MKNGCVPVAEVAFTIIKKKILFGKSFTLDFCSVNNTSSVPHSLRVHSNTLHQRQWKSTFNPVLWSKHAGCTVAFWTEDYRPPYCFYVLQTAHTLCTLILPTYINAQHNQTLIIESIFVVTIITTLLFLSSSACSRQCHRLIACRFFFWIWIIRSIPVNLIWVK